MKLLLCLSFIGTAYCGWQVQNNGKSVQDKVQDAVMAVYGKRYPVTGCSRTDGGVHANCFYCTVTAGVDSGRIPCEKIPLAMNIYLPNDIAVISASTVEDDFHPRYDVKYKEYEYLIWNERIRNPFYEGRAYHYPRPLDIVKMNEAAEYISGSHDFSAFMAAGSKVTDTVRNVLYCNAVREGGLVRIRVAADGFLYNMVRIITGTLIKVSEGKIKPEEIAGIIEAKKRERAGATVPPHGLYLNKVEY